MQQLAAPAAPPAIWTPVNAAQVVTLIAWTQAVIRSTVAVVAVCARAQVAAASEIAHALILLLLP